MKTRIAKKICKKEWWGAGSNVYFFELNRTQKAITKLMRRFGKVNIGKDGNFLADVAGELNVYRHYNTVENHTGKVPYEIK